MFQPIMKNKRNKRKDKQIEKLYHLLLDRNAFRESSEVLEKYAMERTLPRPKTNAWTISVLVLIYLVFSYLIAFVAICFFEISGYRWIVYLLSYVAVALLFLKIFCIKLIECYQHYAKEQTRRRCVCVPSCSEYAIAVLKKYNVFKALHKIRVRLLTTCGNFGFLHDDP